MQLDRSNLTNAYVSGMKEELNFKGNELTVINTIFTCGMLSWNQASFVEILTVRKDTLLE